MGLIRAGRPESVLANPGPASRVCTVAPDAVIRRGAVTAVWVQGAADGKAEATQGLAHCPVIHQPPRTASSPHTPLLLPTHPFHNPPYHHLSHERVSRLAGCVAKARAAWSRALGWRSC